METFKHIRAIIVSFTTFLAFQVQGQIMISYDGNANKDMVKSITTSEDGDTETYVFKYNTERTLKTLEYIGVYESESEKASFNYSWQEGKLSLTGDIDGMSIGKVDFTLDAARRVTKDDSGETVYTFTYDDAGYMSTVSEDGIRGTMKWEEGNVKEYILGEYKRVFTYGNIVNAANIDFGVSSFAFDGFICLPLGKWSRNMPDNIKEYLDGTLSYDADIEYVLDDRGRITRMTLNSTNYEENGRFYKDTSILDISYDEDFASAIQFVTKEQAEEKIYDISGREVQNAGGGLSIIRSRDGKVRKQINRGTDSVR